MIPFFAEKLAAFLFCLTNIGLFQIFPFVLMLLKMFHGFCLFHLTFHIYWQILFSNIFLSFSFSVCRICTDVCYFYSWNWWFISSILLHDLYKLFWLIFVGFSLGLWVIMYATFLYIYNRSFFRQTAQDTLVWSLGKIPWGRKWQPTSVFLPGESHGQRSLADCSPCGCKGLTQLSD